MLPCPAHTFAYSPTRTARVCTWCERLEQLNASGQWIHTIKYSDGRSPGQLIAEWDTDTQQQIKKANKQAQKQWYNKHGKKRKY